MKLDQRNRQSRTQSRSKKQMIFEIDRQNKLGVCKNVG